jgi:adenosine deaminase
VNSDDPAYFGGQVNQNYVEIQKALDLQKEDLIELARNSFAYALISEDLKEKYLKELEEYVINH